MNKSWSNKVGAGYEVSSKGDRRFSALFARLADGRTIEDAWAEAKGYPDRYAAKNRPAKDPSFDYPGVYRGLWEQWANENPALMAELAAKSQGQPLVDRFAKTGNNQAWALSELLQARDWAAVAAPPAAAVAVVPPAAAPVQLELPVGQGPRMAGDAWPWIAAAGGGSLLAAAAVMALQEQEEERAYPQVQQSYGT